MSKPVALVADHAGYEFKNAMHTELEEQSYTPLDLGTNSADSVDYPDMAGRLAAALQGGRAERAVMVCGTGGRHTRRGAMLSQAAEPQAMSNRSPEVAV